MRCGLGLIDANHDGAITRDELKIYAAKACECMNVQSALDTICPRLDSRLRTQGVEFSFAITNLYITAVRQARQSLCLLPIYVESVKSTD